MTLQQSVDHGEGFPNVSTRKQHTGFRGRNENYSELEITKLLDITEQKLPLGRKEWSLIAVDCKYDATECGWCHRENESSDLKFDKLIATRKPTEDQTCPPAVRRVKNISRDMFSIENAGNIGSVADERDDNVETGDVEYPFQIAGTSGSNDPRF